MTARKIDKKNALLKPFNFLQFFFQIIKSTMPHHTLNGVVCKGARALDAREIHKRFLCTEILVNQKSLVLKMLHALKPQEQSS